MCFASRNAASQNLASGVLILDGASAFSKTHSDGIGYSDFFQLHFDQFPTEYLTHSTFAETARKLVPGRPISNFLEECPQATPSRLGPPSRECAHPGGLTSSAQFRFVGPVGTWVEYSTQWSGKPLIPLGPAPGRNHMFKKISTATINSPCLPLCGIQEWAHIIRYRSPKLRPCQAAWSLPPKKASQPTSLYRVSGLHFAS